MEAQSGKEEFGQQRLAEYTNHCHSRSGEFFLTRLVRQVQEFARHPHDDLTVMVLRVE